MIKRERYLSRIRGFYHSDLIKVITGIRRSGKSVLLTQIKEELREQGIAESCEMKGLSGEEVTDETLMEYMIWGGLPQRFQKYVISFDKMDFSRDGIIHKNAISFLLEES